MEVLIYIAVGVFLAASLILWGRKELEGEDLFRLCAVAVCSVFIWPLIVLSIVIALFVYLVTKEEEIEK